MRRRAAWIAALLAACTVARPTLAAEDDEARSSGVRLGVQSGFSIPIGKTFTGSGAIDETVRGIVPIRADVGARIAGHFYVGGLFEYGVVMPNACPGGTQCSGSRIRVGAAAAFHFLPARIVDPWIGVVIAYENLSLSRSSPSFAMQLDANGIDLPSPEIGVDLRPISWLRLGPVVSGAMGRYSSLALNGNDTRDFDPAWHAWISVGFRTMADF